MSSKRDYYEVLGVGRSATEQEIKSAYRRLAVRYHPDKNPGDTAAEEKFKEAAEAYSVLSVAEQRARYDRFGHAGVSSSAAGASWGAPGFGGIEDILGDLFGFGDMFGGGRDARRRRASLGSPPRSGRLPLRLEMTLEEAAAGTDRAITYPASGKLRKRARHGCGGGHAARILRDVQRHGAGALPAGLLLRCAHLRQLSRDGTDHPHAVRQSAAARAASSESADRGQDSGGRRDGFTLAARGEGEAGTSGRPRGRPLCRHPRQGTRAVRAAGQQSLRLCARHVRAGGARRRDQRLHA